MSDKTLLNEIQVRKFMKLASLQPLAAGFVEGLRTSASAVAESHGNGKNELNDVEDGLGRRKDRAGQLQEEELDDMALDAEEDASDMVQDLDDLGGLDAVADEEDAADDGRMISVDAFLSALEVALEDAMGDEVEIDSSDLDDDSEPDEHEEENAEDDLQHAADLEADADEDMDDLMETGAKDDGESAGDDSDTDPGEEDYTTKKGKKKKTSSPGRGNKKGDEAFVNEHTDELVEQITKRVAARILKSALIAKK
tara:strand:- start:2785 stop:3546 length:762 start_codon:yes stop_codon:yes gene_type:complete